MNFPKLEFRDATRLRVALAVARVSALREESVQKSKVRRHATISPSIARDRKPLELLPPNRREIMAQNDGRNGPPQDLSAPSRKKKNC